MTPNTPTPELVERYEKLAVRMDERGVMSATEAAQAFREAAAAIAKLTAERDANWNEYLEERSARMASNNREFANLQRAEAAEKSVKELELIRDSHSRDVVTALSECNAALAANKLLSERVAVLEIALEPFAKFLDALILTGADKGDDEFFYRFNDVGITFGDLRRALAAREAK